MIAIAIIASCSGGDDTSSDTTPTTTSERVRGTQTTTNTTTDPPVATSTVPATPAPVPTSAPPGIDHEALLALDPLIGLSVIPPMPAGADLPLPPGMADFDRMFEPGGADDWTAARAQTDVFKLHAWQVRHFLSDEQLVAIFDFLDAHDIPLMFETEPLPPPDPDECDHTESFEGPYDLEMAQRLSDLGGTVDFVAVEEPYHFAHKLEGPGACRYPVERVVDEVIDYVEQIREIYPGVPVGSIEPIWSTPVMTTPDDMAVWLDTYADRAGEPFAFLHLDPDWYWDRWPEVAAGIEEIADARDVPMGVLYNGGFESDSASWMQFLMENAARLEIEYGVTPQHVMIQSWVDQPEFSLPDDDLAALTSGVVRYVGDRTVVDGEVADRQFVATLATSGGRPIVGATLTLVPRTLADGIGSASLTGSVPDDASIAEILIRSNAEGAGPGVADVRIVEIRYADGGAGTNKVPNGDFAEGLADWGVGGEPPGTVEVAGDETNRWIEIAATPDEQVIINGGGQEVVPGSEFELEVTYSITPESIGSTLVAVEFPGFARHSLVLPSPDLDAIEAVTGDDGVAVFGLDDLGPGPYEFEVSWPGDLAQWPAHRTVPADIS